jgi:hypothetical protein
MWIEILLTIITVLHCVDTLVHLAMLTIKKKQTEVTEEMTEDAKRMFS